MIKHVCVLYIGSVQRAIFEIFPALDNFMKAEEFFDLSVKNVRFFVSIQIPLEKQENVK